MRRVLSMALVALVSAAVPAVAQVATEAQSPPPSF